MFTKNSFITSTVIIKHLLGPGYWTGTRAYSGEQSNHALCSYGAYSLVGRETMFKSISQMEVSIVLGKKRTMC